MFRTGSTVKRAPIRGAYGSTRLLLPAFCTKIDHEAGIKVCITYAVAVKSYPKLASAVVRTIGNIEPV